MYFVGVGPGWPTRVLLIIGAFVAAALIALVFISLGGVHTEHDGDRRSTTTTTTTTPTPETCWPFCLPEDRDVPTVSNLYTPP